MNETGRKAGWCVAALPCVRQRGRAACLQDWRMKQGKKVRVKKWGRRRGVLPVMMGAGGLQRRRKAGRAKYRRAAMSKQLPGR